MRYKAQYHPSEIVCPLTFQWIPVEKCLPKLDVAKFCRLSETGNAPSTELDLDEVLILYRRQAMPVKESFVQSVSMFLHLETIFISMSETR